MLKGLIKSELEADQPQKRLAAVKKLKDPKPDEQVILHRLVQSDPDPEIRIAAVAKTSDVDFLSQQLADIAAKSPDALNEMFSTDSLLSQISRRLSDLLESSCSKETADKLIASGSPAVTTALACSSID